MSDKKYAIVTSLSMFRVRHLVELDEDGNIAPEFAQYVADESESELSQLHLGNTVLSVHKTDTDGVVETFDSDARECGADYQVSWPVEKKLQCIHIDDA